MCYVEDRPGAALTVEIAREKAAGCGVEWRFRWETPTTRLQQQQQQQLHPGTQRGLTDCACWCRPK